jgi:hypothetical protein
MFKASRLPAGKPSPIHTVGGKGKKVSNPKAKVNISAKGDNMRSVPHPTGDSADRMKANKAAKTPDFSQLHETGGTVSAALFRDGEQY